MDRAADWEQTSGVRHRIPWLLAVPLMAAGSVAARALTLVCLPGSNGESGNEAAERFHAATHGFPWASLAGVVAALLLVGVVYHSISRVARRPSRTLGAAAFFALPLLAFVAQEIAERATHTEGGVGGAALVGILVGLLLQVPLGLVAFIVAWVVLAVADRVVRLLREQPRRRLRRPAAMLRALHDQTARCRLTLLAFGHPQRGPPLHT
jgi:hypothetical protein